MTEVGRPSALPLWCFSTRRMIVLALCFALQQVVTVHLSKPYDAYLALSGYGMKSGHLWELFTYQFLHTGYIHFAVTLLGFWFLARTVEAQLGTRRFYLFFTLTVILGGILQGGVALLGYVLPESMETTAEFLRDRFGGEAMGASVGLCGCLGAYCRLRPTARLIPSVPISAAKFFWLLVILALVAIVVVSLRSIGEPLNDEQTNPTHLAHLAHLGALLTGLAFAPTFKRSVP